MKKFAVSLVFAVSFIILSCGAVSAGITYDDPDAISALVYKTPYADSQFTTVYTPWLRNFHIMSTEEYKNGLYGGEACQLVRSMDISPVDPDIIYFATDTSGVWKTENGGQNWFQTGNNILNTYGEGLLCDRFDKNTVYAYILKDGAYKSINGGRSWELILSDTADIKGFNSNRFAQDAQGNTYIAAGSGIYRLSPDYDEPVDLYSDYEDLKADEGALFTDIYVSDDGNDIYVTCAADNSGQSKFTPGLYVSHDAGATWEIVNIFTKGSTSALSVTVNPNDPGSLFVSAGNYSTSDKKAVNYALYVSNNSGESFERRFSLTSSDVRGNTRLNAKPFYKIRFGPKGKDGKTPLYICGNEISYPLRRSNDMGYTFSPLHWRLDMGTIRDNRGNGETGWWMQGYAVDMTKADTVWFSNAGEHKWQNGKVTRLNAGFSGMSITYMLMDEEGKMLMQATDLGTVVSTGGSKYTETSYPTFKTTDRQIQTMMTVDPKNPQHIIGFSGNSNSDKKVIGIVESFDGGVSFSAVKSDAAATRNTQLLMYDPDDPDIIYSSEHTSYDNGKTWKANEEFLLDISRRDPQKRIAVKGTGSKNIELYFSEDGGKSWNLSLKPGINFTQANFDAEDDNIVWYAYLYDFGKIDLKNGIKTSLKSKFDYKCFQYFKQNPKDPRHIIMTLRGGFGDMSKYSSLYETTDGGETFHSVPGLFTGGQFQRLFFSTTTDEAFITGHGGTFIYDYKKFWEYENSMIKIMYNGKEISLPVMPQVNNNDVCVPLLSLSELLGADDISRDNDTVTCIDGERTIELTVGSKIAEVSGNEVALSTKPYLYDDKIMVSLRDAANLAGVENVYIGGDAPSSPQSSYLYAYLTK